MTIELTVAELAEVTELDLGASPWRRAGAAQGRHQRRRDRRPPVDSRGPERAARGLFGGTVAHGYLTLSLVRIEIRGQERPAMIGEYIHLTYAGRPMRAVVQGRFGGRDVTGDALARG
jgi:acyl dehydratase